MVILLTQFAVNNADFFVIAGLPAAISYIIKDYIRKEFSGPDWTLHVDTLDWYPLLPELPSLNWMDRIVHADRVQNQQLSAIKLTERFEAFPYRVGWLNRRYGRFIFIN